MHGVPVDFSRLRILVVENHGLMRRLLREMLRGFGVQHTVEARDTQEAMERLHAEAFDAVILDFFLGEQDGAVAAQRVRHDETCRNRTVPILLITGSPDHHKVLKARDAGINGMLAKPIAPRELYQRLHTMLAYPRPFVVTRDYVGPMRDRTTRPAPQRPSASGLTATGMAKAAGRRRGDPNEDGILM